MHTARNMWRKIAKDCQELGYDFDDTIAESRMKTLLRGWLGMNDINDTTGESPVLCPFQDELDELFKDKPYAKPLSMLSS